MKFIHILQISFARDSWSLCASFIWIEWGCSATSITRWTWCSTATSTARSLGSRPCKLFIFRTTTSIKFYASHFFITFLSHSIIIFSSSIIPHRNRAISLSRNSILNININIFTKARWVGLVLYEIIFYFEKKKKKKYYKVIIMALQYKHKLR